MASRSAIITSMMLGGIRMPSVPTAHIGPGSRALPGSPAVEHDRQSEQSASRTTEAPMMPVRGSQQDADDGDRDREARRARGRRAARSSTSDQPATPERSSITPIRMNIGQRDQHPVVHHVPDPFDRERGVGPVDAGVDAEIALRNDAQRREEARRARRAPRRPGKPVKIRPMNAGEHGHVPATRGSSITLASSRDRRFRPRHCGCRCRTGTRTPA